jgi:hypothetical protein
MSRTGGSFIKLVVAGLVLMGVFVGCDEGSDTFECGADQCLGATEYCEVVLEFLSNDPISETCKSSPAECSGLAPEVCDPDDDESEEALAQCVQDSVRGASGNSWSCFLGSRELYVTIMVEP